MRIFGLIGYPLGHSFSAGYFSKKFQNCGITDSEYKNFPIEKIEFLPDLIKNNPNLLGLNVTIPYKQQVIPYIDKLSGSAESIGAVNTIKIIRNNNSTELIGYNTDEYGFEESLKPHLKTSHQKALVFGTGGASKAVEYVFKKLNIDYLMVSRIPKTENQISYAQLTTEILATHLILVNTSPLGMFPNIDSLPEIPYHFTTSEHLFFDLVYNPAETAFMKKGIEKGAQVLNGLQMLHLQAEKAWQIWNDESSYF